MVDAVVQSVLDKAGNAILEEGITLFKLPDKVSSVQEKMRSLQSYLKDAESKKADPEVTKLIIKIRDLAQDVEDILDTYFGEVVEPQYTKGKFGFVRQASGILLNCKKAHEISQKIETINKRAADIEASKGDLKAESSKVDVEVWSERKKFLLAREPKRMVGRDKVWEKLKNEIGSRDKNCRIISIVGPGGVGKTTIARKLYNESVKKFRWGCCAMVYVSQEAQAREILQDIARQVGFSDEKMNENLEHNLYLFLQEKKYLIFLDDVWNTRTWDQLRDTLLVNSENGSRIIVTSRHTNVGNYIGATGKYLGANHFLVPLDVLSKNYALDLFKDMISGPFYENEVAKPLKEIGERIVDKCGGLPLAIEVVVGMLRVRGMNIPAWNEVLRTMTQIPENNCLKLLSLSYNDLPQTLKPLFLYLGIFPENREIFVPQLIPLWVAEKFIRADGNQDDSVENQINELISRNLLQACCKKSDGRVRSFRMHSLVHDLCMQLGEENNYFCTRNNLTKARDVTIVRRVTTNTSFLHQNAFQDVKIPKMRALFCFYKDDDLFKFLKDNALDLQFLRLLIIENHDGKVVKVPEEIANLSGLIYLKMIGNVSEIPESIRRLRRLQTLEIRSTDIPEGILKMKHVKHLFLGSLIVVKKPHGLPCFKSLTDLDGAVEVDLPNIQSLDVDFGPKLSLTPSSVKKLTSLKSLGIYVSNREMMKQVFPAEPVLPNIEAIKLKIYVSFFDDIPKLDLYEYHALKKLNLYFNTAHDMTGQVVFPPHVVKISLKRVINIEDHMDSLKKLYNLESLKLKKCKANRLDFSGEGNFPKLQLLMLKYTVFNKLVVDEYGIPRIYKFIYEASPLLENVEIPGRLQKVMEKEVYEV